MSHTQDVSRARIWEPPLSQPRDTAVLYPKDNQSKRVQCSHGVKPALHIVDAANGRLLRKVQHARSKNFVTSFDPLQHIVPDNS